eukprot:scaffold307_cov63-Phaeocystis_antarctica.AAC.2
MHDLSGYRKPLSYKPGGRVMVGYNLNSEHPGGYSSSFPSVRGELRRQDQERNLMMCVAAAARHSLRPSIESTPLAPGPPAPCSPPPGPTGAALNPRASRTAPPPSYSPRTEGGTSVGR